MLLKPVTYGVIATVWKTLADSTNWQYTTFDLTPYRGQSIVLYFEVYNDDISTGARTWMYLDDVSVQACSDASSTPTSTPTAPSSPTPTRTPTPSPTLVVSDATSTPTRHSHRHVQSLSNDNSDNYAIPHADCFGYTYANVHAPRVQRTRSQQWIRGECRLDVRADRESRQLHDCAGSLRRALSAG